MKAVGSNDSITEAAYRRIRGDLLSCRLPPGVKLHMGKLQIDLDVSLCAVREALARLTAEGFVIAKPQKGFHAAPVSVDELHDLTKARVEIECLCLRNSMSEGGVDWETRIVAANHQLSRIPMRSPRDAKQYNQEWDLAHDEFHESLVAACGNRTLLNIRKQLFAKSARYRWLSVSMTSEVRDLQGEHQGMANATLSRDTDKAVVLLTLHIKETSRLLVEGMASQPSILRTIEVPRDHTAIRVRA